MDEVLGGDGSGGCGGVNVGVMEPVLFFFSSRRRHTRWNCDWSSDVCSSDLAGRQALFAARDRLGKKPFFYHHRPGHLAFASELKALLADPKVPRDVDPAAIDAYRSEERRVGKECRSRGWPDEQKKNVDVCR